MKNVLFVCTGNICRSPTAEGVFRQMVAERGLSDHIGTDSCGTTGWHQGEPPDKRSTEAARKRGLDISDLRAREITAQDYQQFDLILAMDRGHLRQLQDEAPKGTGHKLHLFLDPVQEAVGRLDVPDPYYGGPKGFITVLDMTELAAQAWLDQLTANMESE